MHALSSPPPGTVAVTGSASGIGAAVYRQLEAAGSRVIGIDLHDADIIADLATASGRAAAIDGVAGQSGGRLDGLVACAGVGPHVRPVDPIVRTNYFGAMEVLDGLLPALAEGVDPAAEALASNAAILVPPAADLVEALGAGGEVVAVGVASNLDGATVYAATKLALARGVRRRAEPWGSKGVRINAVAPGPTETPMLTALLEDPAIGPGSAVLPIPLGRRAVPEEIANVVVFLLSSQSSFVQGQVLFADGGTDALFRPDVV